MNDQPVLDEISRLFAEHAKLCRACGKSGAQTCPDGLALLMMFQQTLSAPEALHVQ